MCQAYRLSLNLLKSHFFPRRFEFFGIDVSTDGNRPANSKHGLLTSSWPAPEFVRDVAKFVGFAQFYSHFIHHFELRISPLRKICRNEYTELAAPFWTDAAQDAFDEMRRFQTHACNGLITESRSSFELTFPPRDSDMCSSSLGMMMPCSKHHRTIGTEKDSLS